MTHSALLLTELGVVLVASYAAGRVHQSLIRGLRREESYRDGYDQAWRAMFGTAVASAQNRSPRNR